jgi:hypothetical protein
MNKKNSVSKNIPVQNMQSVKIFSTKYAVSKKYSSTKYAVSKNIPV